MRTCKLYLLGILMLSACKVMPPKSVQIINPERSYQFPLDWIGQYEGELIIHGMGSDTTLINMQLTIDQPDGMGLYPWVLKYGETDTRYYGLEVVDATKGHYLIDEYNSIKLDGFLRGNNFITRFEVSGSDLIFHYKRTTTGINIAVHISGKESFSETGGEIIGQDTIPTVHSYAVRGFQSATLYKVK